jgi:predicted acyltransferase
MGESHLYRGEGFPFDPEGILSTIPSVVNVIAGYYTGIFIQKHSSARKSLLQLALAGAGSILVATLWNVVFPINKKIWTSPYVLVTVGIDLVVLALLIQIIERRGWTKWTEFFTIFGKNTLFIYVLSEFIVKAMLYIRPAPDTSLYGQINDVFQSVVPGELGSLLFAITVMLLCWGVGKVLDWKKIYIKV